LINKYIKIICLIRKLMMHNKKSLNKKHQM
jgi:hypothetical protein